MKVKIELKETSQGIVLEGVTNSYTKGPFFCVYQKDKNAVQKFPLADIFRVTEDYNEPVAPGPQLLNEQQSRCY